VKKRGAVLNGLEYD